MKPIGFWLRWKAVVPDSSIHIRRVSYPQDGARMADLMEIGFGELLDAPSRAMLAGLRRWSSQGRTVWRFATAMGLIQIGDWLDGFGAYDGTRLVGNTSLARSAWGRDVWLVGNVAVHPEYRKRGIARMLMQAALDEVRLRGGRRIVLQVDEDNDAARGLYRDFDFRDLARRSTWVHRTGSGDPLGTETGWQARLRRDGEWRAEYALLKEMASEGLSWNVPLVLERIRPSLSRRVGFFLAEEGEAHWLAWEDAQCQGVAISHMGMYEEQVLLICRPEQSAMAAQCLLRQLRREAAGRRAVTVEADASIPLEIFEELGFRLQRALIWLERYI
jgi:ribosomal protein S18 acetylase RimI-like enzyme